MVLSIIQLDWVEQEEAKYVEAIATKSVRVVVLS